MGYIHYLCEQGNRKELIEELGSIRMADGFLQAHREMREQEDNKAFGKLNEIVDESLKEVKQDINKAKKDGKDIKNQINGILKQIEEPN